MVVNEPFVEKAHYSQSLSVQERDKSPIVQERDKLVKAYFSDDKSLADKIIDDGSIDFEAAVAVLLHELVRESDNLLGNQLFATNNGEIRDASIISHKRAQVIQMAVKTIQHKGKFDREYSREVDLDSPAMAIVFRYFLQKVKDVFYQIDFEGEQMDVFFRQFSKSTENWKKELKGKLNVKTGSV